MVFAGEQESAASPRGHAGRESASSASARVLWNAAE